MALKASQPYWYTLAQKSVLAALVLVACQPVWLCFGQPINGTLGNGALCKRLGLWEAVKKVFKGAMH